MRKRIIALLLTVVMLFTLIPTEAFADQYATYPGKQGYTSTSSNNNGVNGAGARFTIYMTTLAQPVDLTTATGNDFNAVQTVQYNQLRDALNSELETHLIGKTGAPYKYIISSGWETYVARKACMGEWSSGVSSVNLFVKDALVYRYSNFVAGADHMPSADLASIIDYQTLTYAKLLLLIDQKNGQFTIDDFNKFYSNSLPDQNTLRKYFLMAAYEYGVFGESKYWNALFGSESSLRGVGAVFIALNMCALSDWLTNGHDEITQWMQDAAAEPVNRMPVVAIENVARTKNGSIYTLDEMYAELINATDVSLLYDGGRLGNGADLVPGNTNNHTLNLLYRWHDKDGSHTNCSSRGVPFAYGANGILGPYYFPGPYINDDGTAGRFNGPGNCRLGVRSSGTTLTNIYGQVGSALFDASHSTQLTSYAYCMPGGCALTPLRGSYEPSITASWRDNATKIVPDITVPAGAAYTNKDVVIGVKIDPPQGITTDMHKAVAEKYSSSDRFTVKIWLVDSPSFTPMSSWSDFSALKGDTSAFGLSVSPSELNNSATDNAVGGAMRALDDSYFVYYLSQSQLLEVLEGKKTFYYTTSRYKLLHPGSEKAYLHFAAAVQIIPPNNVGTYWLDEPIRTGFATVSAKPAEKPDGAIFSLTRDEHFDIEAEGWGAYIWSSASAEKYDTTTTLHFEKASAINDVLLEIINENKNATISITSHSGNGGFISNVVAPTTSGAILGDYKVTEVGHEDKFYDKFGKMLQDALSGARHGNTGNYSVVLTGMDEVKSLWEFTSGVRDFHITNTFIAGTQNTNETFAFLLVYLGTMEFSIKLEDGQVYNFSSEAFPFIVLKDFDYINPPPTPIPPATLTFKVDATPDNVKLEPHVHDPEQTCAPWIAAGAEGSCPGNSNPVVDDPETHVNVTMVDNGGLAQWRKSANDLQFGGTVVVRYRRAEVKPEMDASNIPDAQYEPLDFSRKPGYVPPWLSALGFNPLNSSVTIHDKTFSKQDGTFIATFSDAQVEAFKKCLVDLVDPTKTDRELIDRSINKTLHPADQVKVDYKVEIAILVNYPEQDKFSIYGQPDHDTVSWYCPGTLKFWSVLEKNYAELKQGAILNEDWEAMAGTPTTRNMYFASGGNQWVVQATYEMVTFAAQRKYSFRADTASCKYDYSLDPGGWGETGTHDAGTNGYGCFTAASDSHNGCNDPKKHTTGWSHVAEVHVAEACTCEIWEDEVTGTDEDGNDITTSVFKGFEHPAGHCSYTGPQLIPCSWTPCVSSADQWDDEEPSVNCGLEGCGGGSPAKESDSCPGNGSWSVPEMYYIPDNSDLQSYEIIPARSGEHCLDCCDGGHSYEHSSHQDTYSEDWYSLMTDLNAMSIKDLKVWKLEASKLEGTAELFGINTLYGSADNVPHIYTRRVKDRQTDPNFTGDVVEGKGLYVAGQLDVEYASRAGRVIYNWFPTQYDTVDLRTTMMQKGEFAGSSNEVVTGKDIYTPNSCTQHHKDAGDDSPLELGNSWIQDKYLQYIESDTEMKGHRYGLTVVSDYIVLLNNNKNNQSIYYHDYTIYAGDPDNKDEDKGDTLYDIANFGNTYNPNDARGKASISKYKERVEESGTRKGLSKTSTTGNINSSYWINENNQQTNYSNSKDLREDYPNLQLIPKYKGVSMVQLWLWNFNKFCSTGGDNTATQILEDKVYYGGYNGRYTQTQDKGGGKYDGTKNGYKSNMSEGELKGTFLYKYFSPLYNSKNTTYVNMYYNDNGNQKPAIVNGIYDLQADELEPIRTAVNGLYSFGQSYVFYKYLKDCEVDFIEHLSPLHRGKGTGDYVSWAGDYGFELTSGYYTEYKNDKKTWTVNDVVIYDPACTEVDVYAYWSPDCQPVYDDRDPSQSYGGQKVFNLEGDGWLNFPLIGNLYESDDFGIGSTVKHLGKGWYNNMDVSEWCEYKYVRCTDYIVVDTNADGSFVGERIWSPGDLIYVKVFDSYGNPITKYRFYIPEMAMEQDNCVISFHDEAINDPLYGTIENMGYPTNQDIRNWYSATRDYWRMHDCEEYDVIDVVGRIGNLTMVDTGDFRFSNFFKKIIDGTWIVPNVVYQVNVAEQQRVLIDEYDIFHRQGGTSERLYNTYGSQTHKGNLGRNNYYFFPLRPSYNNIRAFNDEPVRIGYDTYLDIETIGNYYSENSSVTIKYSYYGVDKNTGELVPLDVYMTDDLNYVKLNDFNNNADGITNYPVYLKWVDENARRQYTALEDARTKSVAANLTYPYVNSDGQITQRPYTIPEGNAIYQGDRNELELKPNSRTFVGDYHFLGAVDGFNEDSYTNVGSYYDPNLFYRNSQKWYFSEGLPSSAVFVEHGDKCTNENIEAVNKRISHIVSTAYIVAKGDVWTLVHNGTSAWGRLKEELPKIPNVNLIPKPDYNPDPDDPRDPDGVENPPTPITIVTTPDKTSRDDVDIKGTH